MAYEITYTPLKKFTGIIGTNSTNVSGSDLSVSLFGLQEYVNYSIQIRAYTIEGPGPYTGGVIPGGLGGPQPPNFWPTTLFSGFHTPLPERYHRKWC